MNNKQKILFHKEYKNIKIPGVFVGGLYVGMYEMSIGDLLILWDKTEWHTGTCYYYNIIGTPLSGMNNACWYDIKTKRFETGSYFNGKYGFSGLAKPALDYLKAHKTKENNSKLLIFDLVKQLQR